MTVLRLERISKSFGSVCAVDDVSLTVEDGSLVALVGPSGCGKSTLLRLIAGLEECDQGRIWFDDRQVDRLRACDRDVAMVFQDYALYPHLDVSENLTVGLRLRGLRRRERRRRAAEIAGRLGLSDVLDRTPTQLSGGQRQRVAVGRVVLRDPQLLLLDEPLSNLDAGLRDQVRSEIRAVQRQLGVTAVFVTHDQAEALAIADEVVVMLAGRVIQVGTPEELYRSPANLDVARMIGDAPMNFRPGCLARGIDGSVTLDVDGAHLHRHRPDRVPESNGVVGGDGTHDRLEVVIGLRSCDIVVSTITGESDRTDQIESTGVSWNGYIEWLEFHGSRTLVTMKIDDAPDAPTPSVSRHASDVIQLLVPTPVGLAVGDRIGAFVPSHALHVFDERTGHRLLWAPLP